jgi:hypothetical protein
MLSQNHPDFQLHDNNCRAHKFKQNGQLRMQRAPWFHGGGDILSSFTCSCSANSDTPQHG